MTNAEIIQKLIRARQTLVRGWCQAVARHGDSTCLYASLWGEGEYRGDREVILALVNAIKRPIRQDFSADALASFLVRWNDEPERTQQEVLDLVDRTIASLMKVEVREELVVA